MTGALSDGVALIKRMHCDISGLVSQPHLNGGRCSLQKFVKKSGRWNVHLEDGKIISVRPENLSPSPLEKGTQCDIAGVVSAPMLNGRRCRLEKLENGRWTVLCEDGKTISLKPSNLSAALASVAKKRKLEENAKEGGGSGGGTNKAGKKKPIVGYLLFAQHSRKVVKKSLPAGASANDVTSALGVMWKELSEDKKTAWIAGIAQ